MGTEKTPGRRGVITRREALGGVASLMAAAALSWTQPTGAVAASSPSALTLPLPSPPEPPVIPSGSVSVADFGAVPDDGVDDSASIQQAIESVAAAGGGTVWFEPGTYDVSIQPELTPIVGWRSVFLVHSNVRFAARERGQTTIRLADAQGHYHAIFASGDMAEPPHDVAFDGLVIDQNAGGNPVNESGPPFGSNHRNQRTAIRFFGTPRTSIEHCVFTNSYSITIILFSISQLDVHCSDLRIHDCRFDQVGGSAQDYDHSSVNFSGPRFAITDSEFETRSGPGTNGARTAIEFRGNDQSVTGCSVSGYVKAVNVTGSGPVSESNRQLVSNNQFSDLLFGLHLYHREPGGLENITITNNVINLDVEGWADWSLGFLPRCGLMVDRDDTAPIDGLLIADNEFLFGDTSAVSENRDFLVDSESAGIVFRNFDDPGVTVRNFEITENLIDGPISSGVWSDITLINGRIVDNFVCNPGQNGTFDPPKDYGPRHVPYSDDFRRPVYLRGSNTNIEVSNNFCDSP